MVQFAETDMAGIGHFTCYFRYMEEAEHALWRSRGLQIAPTDGGISYPRVSASCEFKAPMRFEDIVDVHVRVEAVGTKSLRYGFTLTRGEEILATGSMTSVCIVKRVGQPIQAIDLPSDVVAQLRSRS